jgi:hypothetical protein
MPPPTPPACPTPPADRRSIYADCQAEAERFKWIASERAGRDLGEAAIRQWVREHWWGYLRARWLEHLQGKCFWIELDRGDYGFLQRAFQDRKDLLDCILGRLKDGQENLDIILWAACNHVSLDSVREILTALDINSRRLVHGFESASDTYHGSPDRSAGTRC